MEARPGLAAMATPAWLLDSCAAYAFLNPAAPPYAHPAIAAAAAARH
jgi:hypothetical protein